MAKKVSVIITTCNGDDKLIRAVNSVINQTYKELEVIVVDDNGKNSLKQLETEKMLSTYIDNKKIKYIVHEKNRNGAVARNTGVQNATGTYLAFLDDDDFYFTSRIEKCISISEKYNSDIIYSNVLFIMNESIINILRVNEGGFSYQDLLVHQGLLGTGSNIFLKKDLYLKVNGFDESFFRYQDVEFMIRALKIGKIHGINECLVVKDITNVRFYPSYGNFIKAQEMFLKKFEKEIKNLSPDQRRTMFYIKRTELYYSACMSRNKENIITSHSLLKKDVDDMSKKELLVVNLRGKYIRYFYNLFKPLREIKLWIKKEEFNNYSEIFIKN